MGLDASTLTRNLQPLVAAGWLVQVAGANARTRLIELDYAGARSLEAAPGALEKRAAGNQRPPGQRAGRWLHTLIDDCVAVSSV